MISNLNGQAAPPSAPQQSQGNDGWEPIPAQTAPAASAPQGNDGWEPVPASTSTPPQGGEPDEWSAAGLKLGEIPGDIGNIAKGAIHGAASTLSGVARGVTKYATGPQGNGDNPVSDFLDKHSQNADASTPEGAAQSVGYGGETLLEFLGGEGILNTASGLADASKIMSVLEKSPKLVAALKVGAKALSAGTVQGAQTLARTGDLSEAVKSGAEMGATAGVLGGAGEAIGAVASKLGKAGKTAGELAETAANAPDEQAIKENIQGRLHTAEDNLHTNYENKVNEFADRLGNTKIEATEAPIADKAKEILEKPDPEDHSIVQQTAEARGQKLDKPVRAILENIAEGKKPLTPEDIEAADEANANKPKLLDAQGKAVESPDVEPEAADAEPYDARNLIKLRQEIRALAASYEPGDINARALKRLLWDGADHSSALDDTIDHLAKQSGDPAVTQEYQALRADYRNKIGKYDDPVIKNLMQGKPDDAAAAFIGKKSASGLTSSGKTQYNLDNLKELLGDDAVQQFGNSVFKNIMNKAIDEGTGFNAAQFISNWSKVNDYTKENLFGLKSAKKGQAWVDTELQSLSKDAKTTSNLQKLVRYGLLASTAAGGAVTGATHPLIGTGLATTIGLVIGAKASGSGTLHARELIDYIANNPKTWAAFRGIGKAAESAGAATANKVITTGAKAAVNSAQPTARKPSSVFGAVSDQLGGARKKLTALTDGETTPSAASDVELPEQVKDAVSNIPVEFKQTAPTTDPNNRVANDPRYKGGGNPISQVTQGPGENTIEVNQPDKFDTATRGHELVHVWQNNLPPSVQAKIPDDPKDMSAFDISDVDQLRKQGKTLVDIPREKAATIVQKYIEAKDPAQKAKLQPWVDDLRSSALSITKPTALNDKNLNTATRAPGRADNSVAGANGRTPVFTTSSYKGRAPGMVQEGNIDLSNRPNIKNPDGSHSSVFSMSFGTDKGEVLVPGVGDGRTYPLRQLSTKEALDQYKKTGNNLGTFKTPQAASAYAAKLHNDQAKGK